MFVASYHIINRIVSYRVKKEVPLMVVWEYPWKEKKMAKKKKKKAKKKKIKSKKKKRK